MADVVISPSVTNVTIDQYSGAPASGGGSGSVTSVSVTTANGVSGSVANATTTPAITITLGAITPSSIVASGNISGLNLSGTNTGDQDLSGLLVKASNLSDLTNASTARTNLGLGTAALSAATDFVAANVAIVGATKTKITYDAKGLVTAGADATTADIADSLNKRYVTDAHLVILGNTSNTNTGDQTITLTGDVTGTGTGSFATTIANNAVTTIKILDSNVTLAKIANIADLTFLGNNTGGAAAPVALTVANAKTMLGLTGTNSGDVSLAGQNYLSIVGQTITAAAVDLSGTHVTGTLAAARVGTFTGDVTSVGATYALTIANDAVTTVKIPNSNVTYAKIQDVTQARLLGRYTASTGVVQEISIGTGLALDAGTGVLSATASGGTPGGSDTQIQYNNGGAFGGTPSFVYNDATDVFTLGTYVGTGVFVTINTNNAAATGLRVYGSAASTLGLHVETDGSGGIAGKFSSVGTAIQVVATGSTAIGISATTEGGQLFTGTTTSADTNVATRVLATFGHNTSGTAAANFGARIELQLESSTTAGQTAGYIQWDWLDASHAGRDSRIRFYGVQNGSAIEILRIDGSSGQVYLTQMGSGSLVYTGGSGILTGASMNTATVVTVNNSGIPTSSSSSLSFDHTNFRLGINQSSPAYKLHMDQNDASTNTVVDMIGIDRNSTGTPAAGIGSAIIFRIETSTTTDTEAVRLGALLTNVAHANRASAWTVQTMDNGGSLTERLRVGGLATKFSGGIQYPSAAKTADYTMLESDHIILVDSTSGARTITLPPATLAGQIVRIKRTDASANNSTVSRAGSDTIEGANTVTLAAQYDSVTLIADGTATWYVWSTT